MIVRINNMRKVINTKTSMGGADGDIQLLNVYKQKIYISERFYKK